MTQTSAQNIVSLTAQAVTELQGQVGRPENLGKFVEQGGCSGMQYGMTFDEKRDGDHVSTQDGMTVLVDDFSAQYLRGTVVDYSDALTGGGFKISNPNAKQNCGCGKSFQT
jgi:iron-sulfur cluster assembly accessory protein